jgi:hypothetical protein
MSFRTLDLKIFIGKSLRKSQSLKRSFSGKIFDREIQSEIFSNSSKIVNFHVSNLKNLHSQNEVSKILHSRNEVSKNLHSKREI